METKGITFPFKYAFFCWEIFESNNFLKYIANQIIKSFTFDPFYLLLELGACKLFGEGQFL